MATRTTFKVWIEVEECVEVLEGEQVVDDEYLEVDLPFGLVLSHRTGKACFVADTAEAAVAFATRLNELADQLPPVARKER